MRYQYINFTAVCTFRSNGFTSTNCRVAINGKKINFVSLFREIIDAHDSISFRGGNSEVNIIISTDKGIYHKNINNRKLEKIFKRLAR